MIEYDKLSDEHYDNTHDKYDPEDWMEQKRLCCIELGAILEKHF